MRFDPRARATALALGAVALAALAVGNVGVGCTSGVYDGSAGVAPSGPPTSVRVVPTGDTTATSSDDILTVTIPAGAFATTTTLTITPLAHRAPDNVEVPAYTITADAQPVGRLLVSFKAPNGGGSTLQAAIESSPGQLVPLAIGGHGGAIYFGVTAQLGTFSLTAREARGFYDSTSSCFASCCNDGNNRKRTAAGASCQCQTGGNGNAAPDEQTTRCLLACPAEEGARCEALASEVPSFPCTFDGGGPASGAKCGVTTLDPAPIQTLCCVRPDGGCEQGPCGGGVAVRCSASSECPPNTTCCASGNETFCARSCNLPALHVCSSNAECNNEPCQESTRCPFRTCGSLLTGCK